MKKIVAATVLLFISVYIQAQPARPPSIEERLKRTDEMIRQEVQPTSAQQNSIMATFKTFFLAEEKLRKDNPPPPPDAKVKAAMDKLLKERDDSIKKILTADQYKKYLLAEKNCIRQNQVICKKRAHHRLDYKRKTNQHTLQYCLATHKYFVLQHLIIQVTGGAFC